MKRLIFSPRAGSDIDQIYDYTEENWDSAQAESYTFGIRDFCRFLADGSKRGRALDSVMRGYFILSFQSHFIIYKTDARTITIIRILHQRMNIAAHL